jgi:hypothetical protein
MSTYLLAYCVGEFDFVQDQTKHGVLVRMYAPILSMNPLHSLSSVLLSFTFFLFSFHPIEILITCSLISLFPFFFPGIFLANSALLLLGRRNKEDSLWISVKSFTRTISLSFSLSLSFFLCLASIFSRSQLIFLFLLTRFSSSILQLFRCLGIRCLDLYDDFFGIPYPLPKLDMIAIPEFAMGSALSLSLSLSLSFSLPPFL